MGILTTQYPEIPAHVLQEGRNNIIMYKYNGSYIILDNASSDGHYLNNIGDAYIYKEGDSSWSKYFLSSTTIAGKTIIFSSFDVIDSNDNILSVGQSVSEIRKNYQSYSTVGDYSSSTFLTSLNGVKILLPAVVLLTVGCIAIRKAFIFIKSTVKGA
jgi:hypothetical protein